MAAAYSDSAAPAAPFSPEAVETARRAYSAGNASAVTSDVGSALL